jgi:hypothetical protein
MANISWKIWTRTTTEKKALEVYRRALKRMGKQAQLVSIEPYPKINGHVILFEIELESEAWNDRIIEAIRLGQTIASGWILTGNVIDDPGGWASRVNDSGVENMEWSLSASAESSAE